MDDKLDIDAPIDAPKGCATSLDHEVWFTELADEIRASADDDPKLFAESIKARRAAAALALKREESVILGRLERARRAMKAGGGSQRAPLRVVSGGQGH